MRFRTSYYAGSGPSYEDCHFLAQRYDEVAGFRLFESECWVMRNLPDDDDDGEVLTQDLFGTQSWLTGLWRAPSGEVFVSDSDGVVHHLLAHGDDDEDDDWVEHPIDCTLFGVHGRAADDVWTWGDAEDDRPALFHWDGDDWREIPGPDFAIVSLHAAGDLRRIGMPNPLPRWALDGAAPAYLNPPDDPTPLDQWLPAAFTETTDADNPRTRTYSRDHYRHGVPALTPHWTTGPDGEPVEAYDLHDYLTQDHLTRHRYTPTKPSLWTCLTTQALTPDVDGELADAANDRGLLTTAITLLRPHANVVDDMRAEGLGFSKWLVRNRLASLLADRGDHNALVELRARAEAGDACAKGVLADSAGRVGVDALGESHADAENGQRRAQDRLAALLVRRAEGGDGHALNQLRRRAETGRGYAQDQLAALLARRAGRGDVGALNELRSRANADDRSALDWLIRLLADRAELGDNGALTELHALTGLDNPDARGRLTRLLADRAGRGHDVALGVLRCCVLAGYGGRELLHVHRARSSGSHVLELDYNANPVYER